MRASVNRNAFTIAFATLCGWAWLALWLWGRSAYSQALHHDHLAAADGAGAGFLALFLAGWTVMTAAMMLPTSLPLINMFYTMIHYKVDRSRLIALLIAGYLAVWLLFGLVALLGDTALHAVVGRSAWLRPNDWAIFPAVPALAGLYQFSSLKYYCLEKCRSPLSFIMGHWRGGNERLQSLRLGLHHGLFCVGCCWSLMLLMFAVGAGHIGWMLALGAVMAAEKNMPWGRRISRPIGFALLAWALGAAILAPVWAAPGAGIDQVIRWVCHT